MVRSTLEGEAVGRASLPAANRYFRFPHFEFGSRITAEQEEFLETAGFIHFKGFTDPATVAALREETDEISDRLIAEGKTHVFGVPLIIGERPTGRRYVQRLCFASVLGARLHEFLKDPRFKEICRIAGPGYRVGEQERDGLVINTYRNEEGSVFRQQGWHTDSLRDVFYFEKPRRYLNVGFYLEDSPVEKGGVRIIPFSHKQSVWNLMTRKRYYRDRLEDPSEIAIEAEAGDLTIHDGRAWHRAASATWQGEKSTRRVMYIPLMDGPIKSKGDESKTPFYHRLQRFAGFGS